MTRPDIPDSMLLPTVSVFADGVWVADGRDPDSDEPQALDGLVIRWGRTTVVDQPQPSTCSLTLMDQAGGTRFLDLLQLGGRLDVQADALITTTPGTGTGQTVISAEFEAGTGDTFTQPGGAARLTTAAGGTTGKALQVDTLTAAAVLVVLPPGPRQPVGGDPTAWDDIPRAISGETWSLSADVHLPAAFAGYAGWSAELVPVTFASPWDVPTVQPLLDGAAVDLGGGYRRLSGNVLPPQGAWVGVAVRFWPVSPAWDELDASTWDQLPGASGTVTNTAINPVPAALTGWTSNSGTQWVNTYAAGEVSVNRQAAAPADWAASLLSHGVHTPANPVLAVGTWWQRSVDVWVDAAGSVRPRIATGAWVGGQPLAAGQWTRVTETFEGTGLAQYVCAIGVNIPGVGTGVHVKLRRGMLVQVGGPTAPPVPYFDGDTADTAAWDYAWSGTANGSTSTATGIGTAATWDELGRMLLDRVRLNAPAAGALRSGMVFSGRITDLEARYDEVDRATFVDVTAADQRAELGSRDVGDEPWVAESLGTRFTRIVAASGQPIQSRVSATAAAYQVSWRDVDRQPAIVLLSELATTADGVLWAATHPTTGPYLELESLSDREALYELHADPDGTVRIVTRAASVSGAVEVEACDVLLDPIRWRHDIEDMATRVAITWREQTLDDKGQPAPTDRTVTSSNPGLEQSIGVHRVAVSTQLTAEVDAASIADAVLGRTGNTQWRVSGLTWRADTTDQLDADALTRMMTLLDGTTRNGLPLLLTGIPVWSPVPDEQNDVALFLEGGTYTSQDGGWVLDLIVSSARAIGQTAAWDELPAGVTPAATRTNRATNPRVVSGGATGWDVPRGWGSGGAGTASYFTSATPPPGLTHNTAYRKTWTTGTTSNIGSGIFIGATSTTWLPATAGKTYTISVYVRHTSGGSKILCPKIGFTATNATTDQSPIGGWVLGTNTTVASGLTWTRLTLTGTAPAGAAAMVVCFDVEPGGVNWAAGNTLDHTALLVEEAAAAGTYFDGATADAPPIDFAWTGAANGSSSTATDTRTPVPGWRWDDFADDISWVDLGGVAAP